MIKKITCFAAAAALVSICATSGIALAGDEDDYTKDTWPMAVNDRPLTLAAGMLEIAGNTAVINLSTDAIAKPISLAPSVFYGVNKKLSVGVTHSTGVCISGTDNGCAKAYDDFGVDALYSVMHKGALQLAAHAGVGVAAIDPYTMGLNLGALVRIRSGKLAIVADPTIYVGITERDARKEQVSFPLWVKFQLSKEANAFVSTGLFGPLDGLGDAYQVPVGAGATYTLSNRIDVGAEVTFLNLAGKGNSSDLRALIARLALRI